jgi:hypothetical protein
MPCMSGKSLACMTWIWAESQSLLGREREWMRAFHLSSFYPFTISLHLPSNHHLHFQLHLPLKLHIARDFEVTCLIRAGERGEKGELQPCSPIYMMHIISPQHSTSKQAGTSHWALIQLMRLGLRFKQIPFRGAGLLVSERTPDMVSLSGCGASVFW